MPFRSGKEEFLLKQPSNAQRSPGVMFPRADSQLTGLQMVWAATRGRPVVSRGMWRELGGKGGTTSGISRENLAI